MDVPIIDLVYFSDPKNSKVDIIQAVGRALRTKKGKEIGYIAVPIYHTRDEELELKISNNSFKNLVQVIRSLCHQDERLQDEINSISFGRGRRGSSKIDFFTPFDEETELIHLIGFEEKLKKSLFDQIIEKTSENWEVGFLKFKEFLDENDGAYPSQKSENLDEKRLGKWAGTQRTAKNKEKLSKDKIEKLDAINFVWDPHEYEWNKNYEALIKFLDENDGAYPSKASENLDEQKLGDWERTQRSAKKRKKLSKDRLEKLNSIGFRW